jgi:hypothetical protein
MVAVRRWFMLLILLLLSSPAITQTCGTVSTCPNASTPFSGNEFLYIVQGGVSKKTTVGSLLVSSGVSTITTNGSITASSSTGAVTLSIALSHPNTYTATQTFPNASLTNAELVNPATTVNGQTCTLGGTCTVSTSATLVIGTTPVSGGTSNGLFFDNAGVLGNLATANNGVLITSSGGVPSISSTLPSSLSIPSPTITAAFTATGLVTNADLVNASTTVNGQTCTLGSTCTVAAAAGTLTGTTLASNVVSSSLTSLGTLTSLTVSGQITSTQTTGTAPFVIASTTVVPNLNAALLNSATFASPGTIGGTTPGAGTFAGLTVTSSLTATGLVTNADLVNAATTVNGQTCTLGSTCTISASAGTISIGVTTVASGTTGYLLYNNGGTLGNETIASILTAGTGIGITGTTNATINCSNATTSATGCVEGDNATLGLSGGVISIALGHANTWTAAQTFNANDLVLGGVTGSTQCLQASSVGVVTGTGSVCAPSGGSPGGSNLQIQYNNSSAFGGTTGITYNSTAQGLAVGGATVTTNTNSAVLNITETWNASGAVFDAPIFENITNTASAAGSLLLDLQVGASSTFTVNKSGQITTTQAGAGSSGGLQFGIGTGNSIGFAVGNMYFSNGGSNMLYMTGSAGSGTLGWISSGTTADTFLSRYAAATLQFGGADVSGPTAQTIRFQNVSTGTSNTAGANTTLDMSVGTGSGAGGGFLFKYAPAGSSGTAQNSLSTVLDFGVTTPVTWTFEAPVVLTGNLTLNITGSTQCLQVSSLGVVSGSGSTCGGGGGGGAITLGSTAMSLGSTYTTINGGITWTGNNTYSGVSTFSGSVVVKVRTASSTTDSINASTDYFVCADNTSAAATENLPSSPATGLTFVVKDCGGHAATNSITIVPVSGNIDGSSSYVLSGTNFQSVAVTYSGSQWSAN